MVHGCHHAVAWFDPVDALRLARTIPLNQRVFAVLDFWAANFPDRKPDQFVFPSERYGASGDKFGPCVYNVDPKAPIGRWKEAWEAAKKRSNVQCRFHDLRHTGCTRMLEAGVSFPVLASLMGWSPATTIRMAKRYGHIGHTALRSAVEAIADRGTAIKTDHQNQAGPFDNPFDLDEEEKLEKSKL